MLFHSAKSISDIFRTLKNFETFSKKFLKIFEFFLNRAQNMNSKTPEPNCQVSIYMNHQNEMEIAEKFRNLPYTLKKLQDFTFSEIKFLLGGVWTPPTSTRQLTILLRWLWEILAPGSTVVRSSSTTTAIKEPGLPEVKVRNSDIAKFATRAEGNTELWQYAPRPSRQFGYDYPNGTI